MSNSNKKCIAIRFSLPIHLEIKKCQKIVVKIFKKLSKYSYLHLVCMIYVKLLDWQMLKEFNYYIVLLAVY